MKSRQSPTSRSDNHVGGIDGLANLWRTPAPEMLSVIKDRPERLCVRQDNLFKIATSSQPISPRPATMSRVYAMAWPTALTVLVATTTLAVAYYGSVWLAPAYLVLMALILGVPGSRRDQASASENARRQSAETAPRDAANEENMSTITTELPSSSESFPRASNQTETVVVKTSKKGRSRSRKPKVTVAALAESEIVAETSGTAVAWVRVGPGKFVRADAAPNILDADAAPVFLDTLSTTVTEPEPATAPDAGDVGSETEGQGFNQGVLEENLTRNLAESHAPEALDEPFTEDNGIAPDAFVEAVMEFPESVIPPRDEASDPVPTTEIEPFADAVTEPGPDVPPEPLGSCLPLSTCVDENAPGDVDHPEDRGRSRSVKNPAAFRWGMSLGRIPVLATTAGAPRALPGNVRSIQPSRIRAGSGRSPRGGRGSGRSHPIGRTHPPRSPPCRMVGDVGWASPTTS